jgi:hypothetical protein
MTVEDSEVETLSFLGYLRKRDPVVALTTYCNYIENDEEDEGDEWTRIAITPDENGAISLTTSYDIMCYHYTSHAPIAPTIICRSIVHSNLRDRMDAVRILDTSDDFEITRRLRAKRKEVVKKDPIVEAFEKLTADMKGPKVEPKPDDDSSSSGNASSTDSEEDSDTSDNDSDEDPNPGPGPGPAPDPEPPAPPEPKPWVPTPGHIRVWLTRTGRKAKCSGCGKEIDPHQYRMLFHPDPQLNPDKRVWRKTWSTLYINLFRG